MIMVRDSRAEHHHGVDRNYHGRGHHRRHDREQDHASRRSREHRDEGGHERRRGQADEQKRTDVRRDRKSIPLLLLLWRNSAPAEAEGAAGGLAWNSSHYIPAVACTRP